MYVAPFRATPCTTFCAGGGKTECYRVLRDALTLMHEQNPDDRTFQRVQTSCLNPKSVSMSELYGNYNAVSNDWKDGVASKLVREAVADESDDMHWLVFDGPVDAVWVENLNTVSALFLALCDSVNAHEKP